MQGQHARGCRVCAAQRAQVQNEHLLMLCMPSIIGNRAGACRQGLAGTTLASCMRLRRRGVTPATAFVRKGDGEAM